MRIPMLTENDVIKFVCKQLEKEGFEISQQLNTSQVGIDIIAQSKSGSQCYVEAKGATSSKSWSSRFEKGFSKSQVKTHIGVALVAAFKVKDTYPEHESIIAIPNNDSHRQMVQSMRGPIKASGIKVWLISNDGRVDKFI
ncbi:hypothetical protein KB973_004607 [Vibrio parahaemolyticus]|nr:hypothetical protein [Vibrio parahaemolyticus]EKZ9057691.1 hypothetical protein [Vibrio vulnificus]EHK0035566.1 hypothetical protein [Vibrio parahaemolyticus]EJC7007787.1 hypothetical protein [Vibrio parahaemolyticus]EJC7028159.1 hypothetical protein [Vibrio parahaemolyticus]